MKHSSRRCRHSVDWCRWIGKNVSRCAKQVPCIRSQALVEAQQTTRTWNDCWLTGSSGTFGSQGTCWVTRSMVAKAVATMGQRRPWLGQSRRRKHKHIFVRTTDGTARHGKQIAFRSPGSLAANLGLRSSLPGAWCKPNSLHS